MNNSTITLSQGTNAGIAHSLSQTLFEEEYSENLDEIHKFYFQTADKYIPRSIQIDIPFNQIPLFDNDQDQDVDILINQDPIFKNIEWTKDPGPFNMYSRGDDIEDIYDQIDNHNETDQQFDSSEHDYKFNHIINTNDINNENLNLSNINVSNNNTNLNNNDNIALSDKDTKDKSIDNSQRNIYNDIYLKIEDRFQSDKQSWAQVASRNLTREQNLPKLPPNHSIEMQTQLNGIDYLDLNKNWIQESIIEDCFRRQIEHCDYCDSIVSFVENSGFTNVYKQINECLYDDQLSSKVINDVQQMKSQNQNGLYGDRKIKNKISQVNEEQQQKFEEEKFNKNKYLDDIFILSDLISKTEMINYYKFRTDTKLQSEQSTIPLQFYNFYKNFKNSNLNHMRDYQFELFNLQTQFKFQNNQFQTSIPSDIANLLTVKQNDLNILYSNFNVQGFNTNNQQSRIESQLSIQQRKCQNINFKYQVYTDPIKIPFIFPRKYTNGVDKNEIELGINTFVSNKLNQNMQKHIADEMKKQKMSMKIAGYDMIDHEDVQSNLVDLQDSTMNEDQEEYQMEIDLEL